MSVARPEVGCSPSSSSSAHRKAFGRRRPGEDRFRTTRKRRARTFTPEVEDEDAGGWVEEASPPDYLVSSDAECTTGAVSNHPSRTNYEIATSTRVTRSTGVFSSSDDYASSLTPSALPSTSLSRRRGLIFHQHHNYSRNSHSLTRRRRKRQRVNSSASRSARRLDFSRRHAAEGVISSSTIFSLNSSTSAGTPTDPSSFTRSRNPNQAKVKTKITWCSRCSSRKRTPFRRSRRWRIHVEDDSPVRTDPSDRSLLEPAGEKFCYRS
ncbi:unnamed protein product, partial [Amoebophrya sp. A120]|eukprot:GSA120T00022728001.1